MVWRLDDCYRPQAVTYVSATHLLMHILYPQAAPSERPACLHAERVEA